MGGVNAEDPHCPECGEPIGMTASYCMHCSADLTDKRTRETVDEGGVETDTNRPSSISYSPEPIEDTDSGRLRSGSGGVLTDLLKAAVGLIGGFVVGLFVSIVIISILLNSAIGILFGITVGLIVWVGATAYLVLKPTVQEAISKAAYGIAVAILLLPLIVFSPSWDGGNRVFDFIVLEVVFALVALVPGGLGVIAAQFIPEE